MNHFHHSILQSTVLLGAISAAFGQATLSPLDGLTPPSLAPGTPAGSYVLSDFETVDLFSGALNFHLPLAKVGGSRGEAAYTMMLPIQQIWHVEQGLTCEGGSCDVQFYYPVPTSWNPTPDLYGPGRLDYRYDNPTDITACQGNLPIGATQSLTRLTFTAAGGTEYELRDDASNGMPNLYPVGDMCTGQSPRPASRGTTFSTHDGSALRFVSDLPVSDTWVAYALTDAANPPTGNLLFPNGTLYRVVCGQVVYIRDRNGNITNFQYDNVWTYNSATGACSVSGSGFQGRVTQIVDSIGRQIVIIYGESPGTLGSDVIRFTGFQGTWRSITVQWSDLGGPSVLRADFQAQGIQLYPQLFPEFPQMAPNQFRPTVVSSVTLPNNEIYQMQYNPYGELARVVLPTGGAFEYDWGSGYTNSAANSGGYVYGSAGIYRRVLTRREYDKGASSPILTEIFSATSTSGNSTASPLEGIYSYQARTDVSVQHSGVNGSLGFETHHYLGDPGVLRDLANPLQYTSWEEGREYQTDRSGMRSEFQTLGQGGVTSWWGNGGCLLITSVPTYPCDANTMPPENPHVNQLDTELLDAAQGQSAIFSRRTLNYDQYNNVTDVYEYDYTPVPQSGTIPAASPGTLLKHTQTNFQWAANSNYVSGSAFFFPQLVQGETISSPSGATLSSTTYEYDAYQSDSRHAPLQLRSGIVQMDTSYSSGSVTLRGNVTGVTRGLGTDATTTSREFDVGGSLVRITDGNGNSTNYDYAANYYSSPNPPAFPPNYQTPPAGNTFALFTKITNALGQFTAIAWDLDIGKPTTITDPNNQPTGADYTDPLDRLKSVTYPDGGTTAYDYTWIMHMISAPGAGPAGLMSLLAE